MTAIDLTPREIELIYSALGAYSDDAETRSLATRFAPHPATHGEPMTTTPGHLAEATA